MGLRVPILTYHKISPVDPKSIYPGTYVPPSLFKRHLSYLAKRGFQSTRVDDLFSSNMPSKPIGITFDDGFQDFADEAFPLLKQFGQNGTVFLVADRVGETNIWDTKLGDSCAQLMNWETIKSLQNQGVEFGSHTLDHCHLDQLSAEEQRKQLRESKTKLEAKLETLVTSICYPYGGFNAQTAIESESAGYKFGLTILKGINDEETPKMLLKRIAIRNDTSLPVFVYKLWRAFTLDK